MSLSLDAATKYLEKQFGDGILMNLEGAVNLYKTVSTGHPYIDWVLGGGMPYGKMVEFFGQPSSGKTTLCKMIAAAVQRKKNKTGRVLWLDYEHAFDMRYFKRLGGLVDKQHLLVSQPETAEDGFEVMRTLIVNGLVDLVVVDSVAAMMSFKESGQWVNSKGDVVEDGAKGAKQQGAMGEQQIGLHARVVTQGIKQINAMLGRHEVAIAWINQTRTKIATKPGQQTTEETTGGRAIKFYAAARIELQRVASIKGKLYNPFENKVIDDTIIAIQTRVKGAKNRVAPPFREAMVTVGFGIGMDLESDLLRMATAHKIIEKTGQGWYLTTKIGGSRNARGDEDFKKLLKAEPKVRAHIMDKVMPLLSTVDEANMVVIDAESQELDREMEVLDKALSSTPTFEAASLPAVEQEAPAGIPIKDIDALLEGSGDSEVAGMESSEGDGDPIDMLDDIASDT